MKSIRTKLKTLKHPISNHDQQFVQVEKRHIQAHLALTELRLRIAPVMNQEVQANRTAALDILHDYWRTAEFPKNTYRTLERTPVFIDEQGIHCAVGHLMARTGYGHLAQQINREEKFVVVEQLDNSDAEQWLSKYGISREDAALIQPGYGGFVLERASYSAQERLVGALTFVASFALLAFVVIALRLLKNKSVPKTEKRNHFIKLGIASVAIIAGFAFYLPTPIRAADRLIFWGNSEETLTCGGFSGEELTGICKEFEENGSAPGWRQKECSGFSLGCF